MVIKQKKSNIITQGLLDYLSETNQREMLPQVSQQLNSLVEEAHKVKEITVCSSIDLSLDQQTALRNILIKMLNTQLPIVNKIDRHLIAGLTVKIGDWFLDASLYREIRDLKKKLLV